MNYSSPRLGLYYNITLITKCKLKRMSLHINILVRIVFTVCEKVSSISSRICLSTDAGMPNLLLRMGVTRQKIYNKKNNAHAYQFVLKATCVSLSCAIVGN